MFLHDAPDSPESARLYRGDLESDGYVMNLSRLWAWRPDLCGAFAALRSSLMKDSSLSPREAALSDWARRVAKDPNATTAADVQSLREAGLAEREIFEATAFVAFRLAFSTINDALGAQPDWQLAQAAPAEVRSAVAFGRPVAVRG